MPSKPRSSAACAQSRIFAGSVPMSRVGKRAFSNIEVSSQGVQFWTGSTGNRKRCTARSGLDAWVPCHAGHYPPKEPRALPQSVEEDVGQARAPADPDAAGRGTAEGAAPAEGGERRLAEPHVEFGTT